MYTFFRFFLVVFGIMQGNSAFGMQALAEKQQQVAQQGKEAAAKQIPDLVKKLVDNKVSWLYQFFWGREFVRDLIIYRMNKVYQLYDLMKALDDWKEATQKLEDIKARYPELASIVENQKQIAESQKYNSILRSGLNDACWTDTESMTQQDWEKIYNTCMTSPGSKYGFEGKGIIIFLNRLTNLLNLMKTPDDTPGWKWKDQYAKYVQQDPEGIIKEAENFVKSIRERCKNIAMNIGKLAYKNYEQSEEYKKLQQALGQIALTPDEQYVKNNQYQIKELVEAVCKRARLAYMGICDLGDENTKINTIMGALVKAANIKTSREWFEKAEYSKAYEMLQNQWYDAKVFEKFHEYLERIPTKVAKSLQEAYELSASMLNSNQWQTYRTVYLPQIEKCVAHIAKEIDAWKGNVADQECYKHAQSYADNLHNALERILNNIATKESPGSYYRLDSWKAVSEKEKEKFEAEYRKVKQEQEEARKRDEQYREQQQREQQQQKQQKQQPPQPEMGQSAAEKKAQISEAEIKKAIDLNSEMKVAERMRIIKDADQELLQKIFDAMKDAKKKNKHRLLLIIHPDKNKDNEVAATQATQKITAITTD